MSQFPTQSTPVANEIDTLVSANRARTPQEVLERRQKPRLSIAELNQMDIDEVREKFLNTRYDPRSPVQQVFDIIDLPRNTIANIVFRDTAKQKLAEGDTAAFGMPRVTFSDALNNMGVENRLVKGIGGFVGDVVLDPLTYLGPAGWGARVGGTALRAGGKRALNRAVKEAAERGVSGVADRSAAELLRAAGVTDDIRDAGEISKKVFGDFSKSKTERFFRLLGGDRTSTGGVFDMYSTAAKTADNVADHAKIDAVRSFVERYGRGTGAGIKIGGGGSEIFHVPGPFDITFQVPGFTPTGKATVRAFQLAKDRSVADLSQNVQEAGVTLEAARAEQEAFAKTRDAYIKQRADLENQIKTVGNDPVAETTLRNLDMQYRRQADQAVANAAVHMQRIRESMLKNAVDPLTGMPKPMSPNDVLAYKEKLEEAQALLGLLRANEKSWKDATLAASSIRSDINANIENVSSTFNRLLEQQTSIKKGGTTKRVVTTDKPLAESLMPDDEFVPPPELSPENYKRVQQRISELRKRAKEMDATNPAMDGLRADIEFEIDMLESTPTVRDERAGRIAGEGKERWKRQEYIKIDPTTGKPIINADPLVQSQVFEEARPILDAIEEKSKELVALNRGATGIGDELVKGQQGLFVQAEQQGTQEIGRIQQLESELAGLRQQLVQVTEPLRNGPSTTLDEFANGLRERSIAALHDKQREYFDLAGSDPVGAQALADMYGELSTAVMDYRNTIGGTLAAHLSPDHKDILEMVKLGLGTSDDAVAMSSMGQMASAFANATSRDPTVVQKFLQSIDRQLIPYFGTRHGQMGRAISNVRARYGRGADVIGSEVGAKYINELRTSMERAGLSLADDTIDDVMELSGLYAHRAADPAGDAIALKVVDANGDLVDSPGKIRLEQLAQTLKSKIPDDAKRAAFMADIQRVANDAVGQLKNFGDAETSEYLLNFMLPNGYVPHVLSADARASKRMTSGVRAMMGERGLGRAAKEPFQMRRVSSLYIFPDIRPGRNGKFEQFFEADRWVMDLPDDAITDMARTDPERAKVVQEMRERIARYESLAVKPPPKQADIQTLNDAAMQGRFTPFAMEADKNLFEPRLPLIMAQRSAMHERAMAKQELMAIVAKTGLNIDAQQLSNMASRLAQSGLHKELVLPNGEKVSIGKGRLRSGNEVPLVYARGQTYRTLDPALAGQKDNPIAKFFTDGLENMVVPESIATAVEDISRVWRDDNVMPMFSQIEKMTNIFKSVTLLHPSWFVNDLVGAVTLLAQGEYNLPKVTGYLRQAAQIRRFKDNPEQLAKIMVNVGGQQMSGLDLARIASEQRTFEQHRFGEVLEMISKTNEALQPSTVRRMGTWDGMKADFKWRAERWADAASGRWKKAAAAPAATGTAWDRTKRYIVQPWAKANGAMNDSVRLAAMLSLMDEGFDVESAADKLRRTMYDFQDLTNVEQKYMRTLFPFYCVPEDSEILTRDGFKSHTDLSVGDEVMTYNIDKDCMEWQPCLAVNVFEHDQELEVMESSRASIRYTPNHRWATQRNKQTVGGKEYGGERRMKQGFELATNDSIIVAAEYHGTDSLLTPDEARLYGWLLTDGYWRFKGNSIEAVIYQHPKKFLGEVIAAAGGKPRKPHPDTGVVAVPVEQWKIKPLASILKHGKDYAPKVATRLSRESAEAMYEAMYLGDGSVSFGKQRPESKKYEFLAAQNPRVAEAMRILCVMLGKRTSQSSRGVYISDRQKMKVASCSRRMEHYKGKVWCPTTANGTWVMRQNGFVTITGNSWMRNNLSYQVRQFFQRPSFIAAFPKLQNALEESLAGEQRVPMAMRPAWMRQELATQIGTDPNSRFALLLGQSIPALDAMKIFQAAAGTAGAMETGKFFLSSMNPVLTAGAQLSAGQEFFSGRSITADLGGDMTAGEFATNLVRPVAEFGPGGRISRTIDEQGIGPGLARGVLGGRVQAFDDDRVATSKARELRDKAEGYRRAITKAERRGDKATSVKARAELLRVYQQVMELGLDQDVNVPKWAKETIAQLANTN